MENLTQTPRVAVLVPCYKRPEYTKKCIEAIIKAQETYPNVVFFLCDDYSDPLPQDYGINDIKNLSKTLPTHYELGKLFLHFNNQGWKDEIGKVYLMHNLKENIGLRNTIIRFFERVKDWGEFYGKFDFIAKMDNDCAVPKNWLNDLLKVFETTDVDILSPNVSPSNAAFVHGKQVPGLPYMPSELVGGLWMMKTSLIKDMTFEKHPTEGLMGAISILKQICTENDVKIGWAPNVVIQDMGHWSGQHPEHIKTVEHEAYSNEVGREIAWSSGTL